MWRGPSAPARRRRRSSLARKRLNHGVLGRHRALRYSIVVVGALSLLAVGGVAVAFAEYQSLRSQLPDAATIAAMEPPQDTHVFARDGTTLIGVLHTPDYRHEHIALNDVSRWARLATVDVEDRHFYESSSWDLPRIVKAAWSNLRHEGTTQGASTITEQLAKISFLCTGSQCDRTFSRKIKQVILGADIESNFSKDQILEMYLNRIPYGNHAVGIETAAQTYFHKSARDLDLAESSMLAGLPNAPSIYNPLNHAPGEAVNPDAKGRQQVVLQAMVNNGDITRADADRAYAEPLRYFYFYDSEPSLAPNFVDYLKQYLQSKFGNQYLTPGGWDIVTSLDLRRQQLAIDSLHNGVSKVLDKNAHDGALVSIDPKTGEVLDMVGSWDYNNPGVGQFNLATSPVQPGSTIKLFTYTTAIASRQFTMQSPIVDGPITLADGSAKGYSPHNYDQRFHGTCVVATCLGNSLNIPAVKVEAKLGVPLITDLEIDAGLTSLASASNRPRPNQYAATLGGLRHGISPLELADGVATVANMGVHHDPAPVLKVVEHGSGRTLYVHDPRAESRRVVPEAVAFIINEITSNDHNRVMEFGANSALTLKDRRVSAKTGTTEFFVDNWTVGWTPDIVTAVLVGNPVPSCLRAEDAATMAAQIRQGHLLYTEQRGDDPYSPLDLAAYNRRYGLNLQPVNDHCGHLEGSTGITGAAPIWNDFMSHALTGVPNHWYAQPPDVVEQGTGDDGVFMLRDSAQAPGFGPGSGGGCYYWGPAADPSNPCHYLGTTAPSTPPSFPSPSANPGPTASPPARGRPTASPTPPPPPPAD